MVKLRGILFIVVFFGLVFQSFCQEEDIFGITRKARPLKSESKKVLKFSAVDITAPTPNPIKAQVYALLEFIS